jgi:hypothetical protein
MTDQQHPITPPPELVQQWASESLATQNLCNRAAQWGYDQRGEVNEAELQKARDQELEACCEWVSAVGGKYGPRLRLARRPKPPSLKEQALEALSEMEDECLMVTHSATIRRALEALPDD